MGSAQVKAVNDDQDDGQQNQVNPNNSGGQQNPVVPQVDNRWWWEKAWDWVAGAAKTTWNFITDTAKKVGNWITTHIPAVVITGVRFVGTVVLGGLQIGFGMVVTGALTIAAGVADLASQIVTAATSSSEDAVVNARLKEEIVRQTVAVKNAETERDTVRNNLLNTQQALAEANGLQRQINALQRREDALQVQVNELQNKLLSMASSRSTDHSSSSSAFFSPRNNANPALADKIKREKIDLKPIKVEEASNSDKNQFSSLAAASLSPSLNRENNKIKEKESKNDDKGKGKERKSNEDDNDKRKENKRWF